MKVRSEEQRGTTVDGTACSHTPGKLLRSRLTFDSTAAVSEWRRGEWRGGGRLEEEDGVAVDFKTHGFGDLAAAYDVAEGGVELVFFVFRQRVEEFAEMIFGH